MSTYDTTTDAPNGGAQEKAQQAKGAARDRVRTEVDTRSTQVGEQAGTVAHDVRSVSEHLRSEGKDKPAEYAEKAAQRVEQVGDYLKRADGDKILRDAEQFGRERPWAVMAGGIVLGIAASRFLKASSSRRYREMETSSNLPARRADVSPGAISPPAPGVTAPVPGAPERELSLTGGVVPGPAGTGR